jgi:hypothetical protein
MFDHLIEPEEEDPITPYAIADRRDEVWDGGEIVAGPYPHFAYLFRRDRNACWARAYRDRMNVVTIMAATEADDSAEARGSRDKFLDDVRAYLGRRYKHVRMW